MTSVAAEARKPVWPITAIRLRLGLIALLVVLAVAAWWWTAREMRGMDGGPWTSLGGLGWFVGVWVVMMAAMMFPSVAPTVALYSRMTQKRSPVPGLVFVGGYLIPWAIAGLAAYGVAAAGGSFAGGVLHWDRAGRWVAGATLLAAAAYELTPLKDYCLGKCRSPLGQLLGSWRGGVRGAVSMGARNGAYCVGITDTFVSPIVRFANESFLTSVEAPFSNSYSAPISLINILFSVCAHYRRARTLEVLKQVDQEQRHGFRWYPG